MINPESPLQRVIAFFRATHLALKLLEPQGYRDPGIVEIRWRAVIDALRRLCDPYAAGTVLLLLGVIGYVAYFL